MSGMNAVLLRRPITHTRYDNTSKASAESMKCSCTENKTERDGKPRDWLWVSACGSELQQWGQHLRLGSIVRVSYIELIGTSLMRGCFCTSPPEHAGIDASVLPGPAQTLRQGLLFRPNVQEASCSIGNGGLTGRLAVLLNVDTMLKHECLSG